MLSMLTRFSYSKQTRALISCYITFIPPPLSLSLSLTPLGLLAEGNSSLDSHNRVNFVCTQQEEEEEEEEEHKISPLPPPTHKIRFRDLMFIIVVDFLPKQPSFPPRPLPPSDHFTRRSIRGCKFVLQPPTPRTSLHHLYLRLTVKKIKINNNNNNNIQQKRSWKEWYGKKC